MSILLDKTVTPTDSVFQTDPSSDFTGVTASGSLIDSVLIKGAQTLTESEKNQVKDNLGITDNDTKNTAGATNNSEQKLYLIGATELTENPQTYSRDVVYVDNDGCLYSNDSKVLTYDTTIEQELQYIDGLASTHAIHYTFIQNGYDLTVSGPFSIYDIRGNTSNYINLTILPFCGYHLGADKVESNQYSQKIKIYLDQQSTYYTKALVVNANEQVQIRYIIKEIISRTNSVTYSCNNGKLFGGNAVCSIIDIEFMGDIGKLICTQTVYK